MVYGTFFTHFVRAPFAGWVNEFHFVHAKRLFWSFGASGVVLVALTKQDKPYIERYKGSQFFREQLSQRYDNPITAIPELPEGGHGEVIGIPRALGGGHHPHPHGGHD